MTIRWTSRANLQLTEILYYCTLTFGRKIALRFHDKIDNDMLLLSKNPYLGRAERPYYNSYMLRSIVEGHYKIFYYVDENREQIVILNLFDCRQDPSRIEEDIN